MSEPAYKTTAFDLKLALLEYFRFSRGWVCVDEFHGADIIVDTGREIIEVETKVTKSDLINGEKKKARKHEAYKANCRWGRVRPNKFLFCVPEQLVEVALGQASEINDKYGVIRFDAASFEAWMNEHGLGPAGLAPAWPCYYLCYAKSAKKLHEEYDDRLRWAIAKRTSSKIVTLTEACWKLRFEHKQ